MNEIVCHGIPDYREVQDGDIVNIDVSVYNKGGFHGDLNETYCVGNVDEDGKMLVKTAFDSLAAAIDLVKPGTLYREIGNTIHKVAHKNKCSVVQTYCGHGVSLFLQFAFFLYAFNSLFATVSYQIFLESNWFIQILYWVSYLGLILGFSSFYSAIVLNPKDLSDQLQKNAVKISGV